MESGGKLLKMKRGVWTTEHELATKTNQPENRMKWVNTTQGSTERGLETDLSSTETGLETDQDQPGKVTKEVNCLNNSIDYEWLNQSLN